MFNTNPISFSKTLLLGVLALILHVHTYAQEEEVIDNKGTIVTVRNNVVTTSATAPLNPLQNDIWIDTTTNIINIHDGTIWINITHAGTPGSLFFAGADRKPTENATELFWNNTTNQLGIGTNTPSNKLHVTGAIRSEGILNSNGTVNEPSYRFNGDSNTGIYSPAADEIGLTVGGIEAINIDKTSNNTKVTINETLELNGQVLDQANSAGTVGQVLSATATGTQWTSGLSPVKAFGKISSAGAIIRASTGVTTSLISTGRYRVTLTGIVTDGNYIIQLTQPGRAGAGNDDPGISYSNQDATGFDVIMGDNDNGGTDRARFNSEFMFTILDL